MYGRNRYKKNQTSTAQPGDLVIMLYDGMLKFTGEARQAIEAGDPKVSGMKITRTLDIVSHLQDTLRIDLAPEVGESLDLTYNIWHKLLFEANLNKDLEKLDSVMNQMKDLRDAWVQANAELKKGQTAQQVA